MPITDAERVYPKRKNLFMRPPSTVRAPKRICLLRIDLGVSMGKGDGAV